MALVDFLFDNDEKVAFKNIPKSSLDGKNYTFLRSRWPKSAKIDTLVTVPPAVICTSGRVNPKGRTREVHAGGTRRNCAVHERRPRFTFYLGQMDERPTQ